MGLLELWNEDRRQVEDGHLHQLIAFAGDGRLLNQMGGITGNFGAHMTLPAPDELVDAILSLSEHLGASIETGTRPLLALDLGAGHHR